MLPAGSWPATSSVHYTTNCNTQSSASVDGQNNCPKHVELTGIINKPLLLHLVGYLYYLYQWCTVNQISDNEMYLLIKYIKIVLWRVAKRLSYIEEARCLKVKRVIFTKDFGNVRVYIVHSPTYALLLNLEKFNIYIKRYINIAPTYFGLRPSSGSLYRPWLKLYLC